MECFRTEQSVKEIIQKLKINLAVDYSFWGELISHVEYIPDSSIATACTNGMEVRYSMEYLKSLPNERQVNFVLLHELLHIVCRHCYRRGNRNKRIWNIACDYVVNGILDDSFGFLWDIRREAPQGILRIQECCRSAEAIYSSLMSAENAPTISKEKCDLLEEFEDEADKDLQETAIDKVIQNAFAFFEKHAGRNSGYNTGFAKICEQIEWAPGVSMTKRARINWKPLLVSFLEESIEDTSYATPERKYFCRDLIVPGYAADYEQLRNVWVFVDSSGSINRNELGQFLGEVNALVRTFNCEVNLAFWNTKVTEVYMNMGARQFQDPIPCSRGGTDLDCVYEYITENHLDPNVLIILTDGCLRAPEKFIRKLRDKTIIVSTGNRDKLSRYGVVAKL